MRPRHADVAYVCPTCRGRLDPTPSALVCLECSESYPVENEIADFGKGHSWDAFEGEESLDNNQRAGLDGEVAGSIHRVDEYFLPRMWAALPPPETRWRVLDCGCGNGVVVDSLNSRGIPTWGVDLSALRKWQWRERVFRRRLATAGATLLPFADGVFDVVLASGLLEHLGVVESRSPDYRVRPSADRDDIRRKFVAEVARVLKPDGIAWLDFPNGAFPIDFWHTTRIFRPRWHSTREGFLPRFEELRRYAAELDNRMTVRLVSPHRRFRFRQAGGRWYGRLLSVPLRTFFWLCTLRPLEALLGTAVNPYLVVELRRREASTSARA